jgi:hypothetical protein
MTKLLLTLAYPLLLITRMINSASGRDPLRLRRPADVSLWIPRDQGSSDASYFSETSPAEAARGGSPSASVLAWVARFYAPVRSQPKEKFSAAADREQGIPDEMYTLW